MELEKYWQVWETKQIEENAYVAGRMVGLFKGGYPLRVWEGYAATQIWLTPQEATEMEKKLFDK